MHAIQSDIVKIGRLKKRSDFLWVQKLSQENKTKWVAKGLNY